MLVIFCEVKIKRFKQQACFTICNQVRSRLINIDEFFIPKTNKSVGMFQKSRKHKTIKVLCY